MAEVFYGYIRHIFTPHFEKHTVKFRYLIHQWTPHPSNIAIVTIVLNRA